MKGWSRSLVRVWIVVGVCVVAGIASAADDSQHDHVPPDPPRTRVHAMPYREMAEMMGMDDRDRFGKIMLNRLEWRDAGETTYEWNAAAWYGGDFNKLWIEAEGERVGGATQDSRVEILWDHIATAWWSTRAGVRQDSGIGPSRSWVALGVAGLAPGFIEVEATAYVGDAGRSALRFSANTDLLVTQRLVLQPELELNAYGEDDAARLIGAGISDVELGLRLRYEICRQFAPYIGLTWTKRVGGSADLARAAGEETDDVAWLAGFRAWL